MSRCYIEHINDDWFNIMVDGRVLLEVSHDDFDHSAMEEVLDLVGELGACLGFEVIEFRADQNNE